MKATAAEDIKIGRAVYLIPGNKARAVPNGLIVRTPIWGIALVTFKQGDPMSDEGKDRNVATYSRKN